MNGNNIIYFDSFEIELIPKEKKIIGKKNIQIFIEQAYNLIVWGSLCIKFIEFMLKGKSFLDCTNLFCLNEYEKNDKVILKYFQ